MKIRPNKKIRPNNVEAVLFDMDGTLVDTERLWFEVERDVAAHYGIILPEDALEVLRGLDVTSTLQVLRDRYGFPLEDNRFWQDLEEAVIERLPQNQARASADSLVQQVVGSYGRSAIVSNSPKEIVMATLQAHTWAELLPLRFCADEVPRGKPHPDLYLHAAKRLKVAPVSCVAVEDSVTGVQAAVAAGMTCVAVTFGELPPERFTALTPYVLSSLEEVGRFLAQA